MTFSQKYDIRLVLDNIWAVYDAKAGGDYLFKGTLPEVNAWLDLKEKGFNI